MLPTLRVLYDSDYGQWEAGSGHNQPIRGPDTDWLISRVTPGVGYHEPGVTLSHRQVERAGAHIM